MRFVCFRRLLPRASNFSRGESLALTRSGREDEPAVFFDSQESPFEVGALQVDLEARLEEPGAALPLGAQALGVALVRGPLCFEALYKVGQEGVGGYGGPGLGLEGGRGKGARGEFVLDTLPREVDADADDALGAGLEKEGFA